MGLNVNHTPVHASSSVGKRPHCSETTAGHDLNGSHTGTGDRERTDGTFHLAPSLTMRCYDSFPSTLWQTSMEDALPTYRRKLPKFQGVGDYCRHGHARVWPTCPDALSVLPKSAVFFGVLVAQKLIERAQTTSRMLALQGARHSLFGDVDMHDDRGQITLLPESARLEQQSKRGRPKFIAQKALEMLMVMHTRAKPASARWWVVCDDDSFIFVDRFVSLLARLNESEPLLVGGGQAQSALCAPGICNYTLFKQQHGRSPLISAHAGGPTYALNEAAMRRVINGLRQGWCIDAPYSDAAVGACARIMGVRLARLPGGFVVAPGDSFQGQIVGYHKLSPRQRLCWARYGECDPRCDCPCNCGQMRCSTLASAAVRTAGAQAHYATDRWKKIRKQITNCSAEHFECEAADLQWALGGELFNDRRTRPSPVDHCKASHQLVDHATRRKSHYSLKQG